MEQLRTQPRSKAIPEESNVYYFYCQEDDLEHRTYFDILKGILHQMIDSNEDVLPLCAEKAESSGNTNLADIEVAQTLVEAFIEYNSRQYIIIDGLDECETVQEMLKTADFFMKQVEKCDNNIKPGQLRVLFISQMIPELAKAERMPQEDACIQLKPADNADDIRAYVKKRIEDFSNNGATGSGFNLSPVDEEQIESITCRQSEGQFQKEIIRFTESILMANIGMFLYAHLAIEYLLQQPTKDELRKKAEKGVLPNELSQMCVYGIFE